MKVAIIGGGLAGCAAAFVLKNAGHEPIIYEASDELGSGASGNSVGLYNPRFGAEWSPQSQYYATAFERSLEVFPTLEGFDFNPCGTLHLMMDDKKATQCRKMVEAWPWDDDMMRIVGNKEASRIAGIDIKNDALYLPQAGSVNPKKLCAAYAEGVEVLLNSQIEDLERVDADIVILTSGAALKNFNETQHIDLYSVRGQVSLLSANKQSLNIQCHICYGGYISQARDNVHMVGATFQRELDHDDILADDNNDNLEKLYSAIASFPRDLNVLGARAGVRCASRDYFPVVGAIDERVYISGAHGSHGILSSLMAAEILGGMIDNKPQSLSSDVIAALCPSRFRD